MLKITCMNGLVGAFAAGLLGIGFVSVATPAAALDLGAIRADIAAHQQIPAFSEPGAPFDARACMKGKKILTVPFSSAIPFVSTVVGAMVSLGKEIGFAYDEYRNTGQRSQWIQGISQGINQKYDLIDLFAPDLLALVPQGMEAKQAGIPIVASHDGGYEQKRPAPFLFVPADYRTAGKLLAEWAIAKTDGKANVLVLMALDSFSTESTIGGMKAVFAQCDTCKVKYVNVAVGDWATRIQPTVQSALLADPTINYILPEYDPMVQFVVPAVELTQSSDRVKIAAFNGTPFALDFVREGKVDMIVGENLDWVAHAIVDAEMRIVCNLPQIQDPKVPLRIFDKTNIESAGTPAKSSTGYGQAYIAGYKKLWNLQ
jgi:ribose transport system substrate-binding protein